MEEEEKKETNPSPSTSTGTTAAPAKTGSKAWIWIAVVVVVVVVLAFVGYYLSRKASEYAAETLLESAAGGEVDVSTSGDTTTVTTADGTSSVSESTQWPSDMPSIVPKFTYGTIESSAKTTISGLTGWTVNLKSVTDGAADKYKTDLTNAGWTEDTSMSSEGSELIMMTKDGYSITVGIETSDKTASLVVSQEATE